MSPSSTYDDRHLLTLNRRNYATVAQKANQLLEGKRVTIVTLDARHKYPGQSRLGFGPVRHELIEVQQIKAETSGGRHIDLVTKDHGQRILATVYRKAGQQYYLDARGGQFHTAIEGRDTIVVLIIG
jgi:hypothetical protein